MDITDALHELGKRLDAITESLKAKNRELHEVNERSKAEFEEHKRLMEKWDREHS